MAGRLESKVALITGCQLLGRGALTPTAVDVGLDHPAAHGLLADRELLDDDRRGSRQRRNTRPGGH